MEYGKFQYSENKKRKDAKAKTHNVETKAIQITIGTGDHDLELKAKKAVEWLAEGHRIKVDLFLRGRAKYMDQKFLKFPAGFLIYGPLLTKGNVEAGNRFMVAFLRALQDYRAAFGPERKNYDEILGILKKYNVNILPQTPSLGIPDDYKPSLAYVRDFLDWHVKSGTIRTMPDIEALVDDRFRTYALDQLQKQGK